jgi:hypothetical protein
VPRYEVELRFAEGGREFRITDRALAIGDELRMGSRFWHVVGVDAAISDPGAELRYVTEERDALSNADLAIDLDHAA